MSDKEYLRIAAKLEEVVETSCLCYDAERIFGCQRSEDNGFAPQSLNRLKNILLYILEKMNKLLFYIDFLSYRELGMAMSGLSYRAIEFGPVPNNWDKVYSQFDEIQQLLRPCGDFEGSVLFSPEIPDVSIFSSGELAVLQAVCSRFYNCSSREISAISHEEKAWIDNCEQHGGISFSSAFELKVL